MAIFRGRRSLPSSAELAYPHPMPELAFELGGGLKGLPLGSSKESVRAFFGNGHQPFKRVPSDNSADYWADAGVFAYYGSSNLLEAIEFSNPSHPTLNGAHLTTITMADAIKCLQSLDPELRIEPGAATSTKLGIGVWRSTSELDQPVMSAITFGPGYYD